MKNETPRVERFFKVALCVRKISVLLITAPLLLSPVMAFANNGAIAFRGQVTNPGCAVQFSTDSIVTQDVRYVEVSDRITLKVNTLRNVCDGEVVPFSVRYEALSGTPGQAVGSETTVVEGRAGIITLTYQ
ncbi:hypothetical protein AFK24_22290 [Pseudomonas syringae]|uniref:Type 1 fimbrial protein n=1 Tax=Pseudomonas syringae TaxID=317 RepID=A0A1C7YYB0_PSESX|nr:hypothetical protein [Pseudomonas syringae]OCR22774.1 hypothetical protein AFK24_22290 [Pseudomonas syringae]